MLLDLSRKSAVAAAVISAAATAGTCTHATAATAATLLSLPRLLPDGQRHLQQLIDLCCQ
jgi:hypothetical protein